ncbi:MAG: peptidylprolyl isomerase [Candidatus Egerieousia sp.]
MRTKFIAMTLIAASALFGCKNGGNKTDAQKETEPVKTEKKGLAFNPDSAGAEPVFDIATTMGTIRIKLYSTTPSHRNNFVKLASQRFYDGILFHRVIKDFMIQTGDPNTKNPALVAEYGSGGPGYTIPAEIVKGLTHKKGALAAARKGDMANPEKASSGSQFYIVADPANCSHLDGEYTIFGETIDGFDVIDSINSVETGLKKRDLPNADIKILHIDLVKE